MTILKINSSVQSLETSVSRQLVEEVIKQISTSDSKIIDRDLTKGVKQLTGEMVGAFFTPETDRTADQQEALKPSDNLLSELMEADTLVIGAPIYNFGVSGALKSYLDLIARAGVTFKYTEKGPEGLIKDKKAILVIASGGTALNSDWDHASGHLTTFLGFIGITDVTIIDATLLQAGAEPVILKAKEAIKLL